MCGIAGYVNFDFSRNVEPQILKKMCARLRHRGPDDSGYYCRGNVGFGFTRLSIVDIEFGQQPMYNEDGSVVLICNGEIFNHKELRRELLKKGHVFRSNCDVEVILHLYEEYGTEFLNLLNGQFAFAIYDERRQYVFMARDQYGILPLYYYQDQNHLVFASEIKALLEDVQIEKKVNLTGLDQVLSFPGLVSPWTMFEGVNSLPAGNYIIVKNAKVSTFSYWDLVYPEQNQICYNKTTRDYIEELDECLRLSVARRLKADVPVGFYLSGGMDSSLIASLICSMQQESRTKSFSITFRDEFIDESKYQRMMTDQLKTVHHEILIEPEDIAEKLYDAIYFSESPLKETYNTASLALSNHASSKNIKAVLTGEGADELFAGYVGYRFDELQRFKNKKPIISEAERIMRLKLWGSPNVFYERNLETIRLNKSKLYSTSLANISHEFDCLNFKLVDVSKLKNRDVVHQRSYLDFKLRLSDHLLSDHGDRMAMANSVEARYPFLDYELVQLATTIPPKLKMNDFNEKYILKEVAKNKIPAEIINREKFEFVSPSSSELLKLNLDWVNDLLSFNTIKNQGFFNPNRVEELKLRYSQPNFKLNIPFEYDELVVVLTFGMFLEKFGLPSM